MPKLNNNKKIKKDKRKINKTLHFGKQLSQINLNGRHLGDKVDQDGILNVQQWQYLF